MEIETAVAALSALAHGSRLEAFRLLVEVGPAGLPAGELATRLGVAPPTLSFHLTQLVQAGLIESRREGRSILYALRVGSVQALLEFLTRDCCQGRPELCPPLGADALDCGDCDA